MMIHKIKNRELYDKAFNELVSLIMDKYDMRSSSIGKRIASIMANINLKEIDKEYANTQTNNTTP